MIGCRQFRMLPPMGYQLQGDRFRRTMHALPHLSAAETRLSRRWRGRGASRIGCVVALTALGWAGARPDGGGTTPTSGTALCQPFGAERLASSSRSLLPMWAAMTLAMMLPTAAPMILTYAEIADTAARKGEPVVVAARC